MNSQYLHVSQFYQTILCFSLLILIAQKILILWKDLNDQYLKVRVTQFDDQIQWKKSFEPQNQAQKQKNKQQAVSTNNYQNRQSLKDQLLDKSEISQTDRSLVQRQEQPTRIQEQKKQTLQAKNQTQMVVKEGQQAQSKKMKQQQVQHYQINPQKQTESSNNKRNSKTQAKNRQISKSIQKESDNINKIQNQKQSKQTLNEKQMKDVQKKEQQVQLTQDSLQKEYKDKQKIRYFKRMDSLFNQYFSIIIPVLILGILVRSTYIFTMVCFFAFIFSSLLFNYANLLSKLKSKPSQDSIIMKTNKLISALFIIALFISYWSDNQFS